MHLGFSHGSLSLHNCLTSKGVGLLRKRVERTLERKDHAKPLYFSSCFKNQGLSPAGQLRGFTWSREDPPPLCRMLSLQSREEEMPLGAQGQWKGRGTGAEREDLQVVSPLLSLCPPWASARLGWGSRLPRGLPLCTPARHSGKQPGGRED